MLSLGSIDQSLVFMDPDRWRMASCRLHRAIEVSSLYHISQGRKCIISYPINLSCTSIWVFVLFASTHSIRPKPGFNMVLRAGLGIAQT